jgi:hypothetical protein
MLDRQGNAEGQAGARSMQDVRPEASSPCERFGHTS